MSLNRTFRQCPTPTTFPDVRYLYCTIGRLDTDVLVPSSMQAIVTGHFGDRAFAVAGPRAWNSLPSDIRTSAPSFDTFKKHLKSYLFQLSFSSL